MKNRKSEWIIRLGKVLLLLAAVSCALFALIYGVSQAVFIASQSAQRTIAAYDTQGERFSSNYMMKGDSKENVHTAYTTDVALPVTAVVTVCNYQQGRQTLPYPDNVSYTFTAKLVRYDESDPQQYVEVNAAYVSGLASGGYSVTVTSDTETRTLNASALSGTFTGSLTGGSAQADAYNVTFSSAFVQHRPNLYLEVVAVPDTASLPTIRGIFKPDYRAAGAADLWTGEFRDSTATAPSLYDGYNYLVTGAGSGSITITWDAAKVQLSAVCRDQLLALDGAVQSGSSITFPVDSDVESRYDLQFYNVNITSETWAQMANSVITFDFQ